MGFYGNIFNYISNAFTKFKVGEAVVEANKINDALEFAAEDGISLDAQGNKITIKGNEAGLKNDLKVSLEEDSNDSDNQLVYIFKQGKSEIGRINVPLDLILADSAIVTEDAEGNIGTFLKLTFKTSENGESIVYIDVKELNEIAGEATDTITVSINTDQCITADINQNGIKDIHIAEKTITNSKIADKTIEKEKLSQAIQDSLDKAHTHTEGSGTKPVVSNGVAINLNIAMELNDKTIKIYDKDDEQKTSLASVDLDEFSTITEGTISHTNENTVEGVNIQGEKLQIVVDAFTKQETINTIEEKIAELSGDDSAAAVRQELKEDIRLLEAQLFVVTDDGAGNITFKYKGE